MMIFRPHKTFPLLVLLIGISAVMAAHTLNADPIWHDEYFSLWIGGGIDGIGLAEIWARAYADLVHPPAYYYLLWGWGHLVGWSAFAGRYLSLLFGVLTVAFAARLATDVHNPWAGVGAAGLLAGSPLFALYMHELRSYTLVALLTVSAVTLYQRAARPASGMGIQAAFMLNVLALFYTHYVGTFLLVALALHHLIAAPKNRSWWRILVWMGVPALVYLVWVVPVLQAYAAGGKDDVQLYVETYSLWRLFWVVLQEFGAGNMALLVGLIVLGGWRRSIGYVWGVLVLTLLITKGFDLIMPVLFNVRYVLFVFGLVAVLGGMGIATLQQRRVAWWGVLAVWLVLGFIKTWDNDYRLGINGPGAFAAWDVTAEALANRAESGDWVVLHLPEYTRYQPYHAPIADYYLRHLGGLDVQTTAIESLQLQPDVDYIREGMNRPPTDGRFWYARDMAHIPERFGVFERVLDDTYLHCGTFERTPSLWLDLYHAPLDMENAVGTFDERQITVAPLSDMSVSRDGILQVALGWRIADSIPPHTYSYALHVMDGDGALLAQIDAALPPVGDACRAHEIDMRTLPDGDYTLNLLVYAWETGERLSATGIGQANEQPLLELGRLIQRIGS